MYKVLIVDDEKIVRIALKTIVRWEQYGFTVVGGAQNGIAALSMVEKYSPDIIITDLKMPKMDGITLIKKLRETGFGGKVLVLSNYGEFELVREAMKLGVYDYILKLTLKSEEFIETMKKIAGEINDEKMKSEKELAEKIRHNESRQAARTLFFKEMLLEEEFNEKEILKKAKLLEIVMEPARFYMLYLMLEPAAASSRTDLNSDRQLLAFSVSNIAAEILGPRPGLEMVELGADRLVFIIPSGADGLSGEKSRQAAVNILRSVQTYLNITVSIVTGSEFQGFKDMKKMYEACVRRSAQRFYTGYGSIISLEELPGAVSPANVKSSMAKTAEEVGRFMEFGDGDGAFASLEALFSRAAAEYYPPEALKKQLAGLLVNTCGYLFAPGLDEEASRQFIEEPVMAAETLDVLKNAAFKIIRDAVVKAEAFRKQLHRKEITLITDYMRSNYKGKITLAMIARHVNLNESYLCRMFKRETGRNLMNYLNDIRLEKAAELLKQPDASIKEVSADVGIPDQFYFSKMFTKHYGISPTDYKKRTPGRAENNEKVTDESK